MIVQERLIELHDSAVGAQHGSDDAFFGLQEVVLRRGNKNVIANLPVGVVNKRYCRVANERCFGQLSP
jgi:hypothetical protein